MARTKGAKNKSDKLTAQQEKFCRAWVNSFNFQQSMLEAGYSESYAKKTCLEDFVTNKIQKRIDELLECGETIYVATPQEILMKLTRMIRREETDQVVIRNIDGSQSVVNVKVSCKEAIRACELLGKSYKMFTDKIDTNVNVEGTVEFIDNVPSDDETIYIEDQDYIVNDDGTEEPIDDEMIVYEED